MGDSNIPPLTAAQRAYLEAFDAWLHSDLRESPDSAESLNRLAAFSEVVAEAGLEPWQVMRSPTFRHRSK